MSEQPTAMDLWKASRHESTLCKVDGVYFFGDSIIEMHFALDRGEMAMSQLRRERDEFAHRIATMKEVIARLERERAAEIEGRKKAEAHRVVTMPATAEEAEVMQKLGYAWLAANAPERLTEASAEIARLTRERDEALDKVARLADDAISIARERDEARSRALDEALDRQPSTAENPNEDAYQRGRFDGVMEYARAILALKGDSHD